MAVKDFIRHHFRHFNSATLVAAAEGYNRHLEQGGKMLLTLAGAMSTAEIGLSLAEMIRKRKVHAICCTGANLEEDLFNLVANREYLRVPNYRYLTATEEVAIRDRGLCRVTDTCIPEESAMKRIENHLFALWKNAESAGISKFPHEYMYDLLRSGVLKEHYQIDPNDSWLVAACEQNLPIFVPGWEDSTMGNCLVARAISGELSGYSVVKSGLEQMAAIAEWYQQNTSSSSIGFFQIGGGISGDFPICVVPMINIDLSRAAKCWGYFCQISDSTTSYGSYSGAIPNEKISWGKLEPETPQFVIESDATIVAPLIFAYVLGWQLNQPTPKDNPGLDPLFG